MGECALRRRVRELGFECDENDCVFWAHLGCGDGTGPAQCAIQYFRLLDDSGNELAEWLLSLKEEQLAEVLGLRRLGLGK
ncbi:MAG: hypothetical protein EG823_03240 [Actinobacteria bacterium]|nr:hypothetical protein [Actinomycetota bacterium]